MIRLLRFFTLIPLFLLTGCITFYTPGAFNVPMLKEKGEYHFEPKTGTNNLGVDFSYASYDNNIAYMLSYNNDVSKDRVENSSKEVFEYNTRQQLGEVGIGYRKKDSYGKICTISELFAGGGYGVVNYRDKEICEFSNVYNYKSAFGEVFLQYNNGIVKEKSATGLSIKLITMHYTKDHKEMDMQNPLLFQTVYFLNFGSEKFRVSTQTGLSFKVNSFEGYEGHFDNFIFSVGLQYIGVRESFR